VVLPKYDPHAAEKMKAGDVPLEKVGKDAAMPWETDGIRWHTVDRLSHGGKPCRWDGEIVLQVEAMIQELGKFAPTSWKQPTIVEISGPTKSQGWFFHAQTGMEWLVRLVFRVAKNTFKQDALDSQLGIPTLNDTPGLEVYSNEPRVKVANRKGPWQEVWMLVHKYEEIDTVAFRQFLSKAVLAFQANLKRMTQTPEDVMPWKVNGESWHLGGKGFPAGRAQKWDRGILPRLVGLMRDVDPKVEIDWTNRVAVSFRLPGISRAWASWRTKQATALECKFLGKKGQFNLSQIESIGLDPKLRPHKNGEILHLTFLNDNHLHAAALKEILKQHAAGFRAAFGKG